MSCCESIVVPGGTFAMGRSTTSGASDYYPSGETSEIPEHPATVDTFVLDKFEVTVGRFRKFVEQYTGQAPAEGAGAHPKIAGSGWQSARALPKTQAALANSVSCGSNNQTWTATAGSNENYPINCVNWYEAFGFCIWDGGRLPTEAEWEYAASGGVDRLYPWGSTAPNAQLANCKDGTNSLFSDVGSTPLGNGRWGHADLAGSLWEWVLDYYDASWYSGGGANCNNCANLTPDQWRMLRGGGYTSGALTLRAAERGNGGVASGLWMPDVGFRCARNP